MARASTSPPPTEAVSAADTPRVDMRALLALGLGNTLEWYDWMVFGILASLIGPKFFPAADPLAATLDALAVFAVGFATRPLGGVLLGALADRVGRKLVLILSIAVMAATTLVIAVLPTHAEIGLWAGVVLLACRLLQGASTGVEAPLSTAYAVELTPPGREGWAAGVIGMFVYAGVLLASVVSLVVSLIVGGEQMAAWGWRIPFAIGAAMGVVVLWLRRALPESLPDAEREAARDQGETARRGLARHWLGVLAIVFVVGAVQAYNYAWSVGLPSLARGAFHEDPTGVFAISTLLGVVLIAGSPLTGRLADAIGLSRAFVLTRLLAIPSVFLLMLYDRPGLWRFAVVSVGGGVVLVLNMTLYNVVAASLMPKHCRGAGVALGYGVAVAAFGGTASWLLVYLQRSGGGWAFPAYVAALSLVSIGLYAAARRWSGSFFGQ